MTRIKLSRAVEGKKKDVIMTDMIKQALYVLTIDPVIQKMSTKIKNCRKTFLKIISCLICKLYCSLRLGQTCDKLDYRNIWGDEF